MSFLSDRWLTKRTADWRRFLVLVGKYLTCFLFFFSTSENVSMHHWVLLISSSLYPFNHLTPLPPHSSSSSFWSLGWNRRLPVSSDWIFISPTDNYSSCGSSRIWRCRKEILEVRYILKKHVIDQYHQVLHIYPRDTCSYLNLGSFYLILMMWIFFSNFMRTLFKPYWNPHSGWFYLQDSKIFLGFQYWQYRCLILRLGAP